MKSHSQFYTLEHGFIGSPTADEIIDKGIEPVELSELIEILNSLDG